MNQFGCEVTVTKGAPSDCSGDGPKAECPILGALECESQTGKEL
ncbi:MAG: hypothetical protein U5J95_03020 [Balneolaceae bacterium]|nr:hypothetical protein [Balneolaceae bacterium]